MNAQTVSYKPIYSLVGLKAEITAVLAITDEESELYAAKARQAAESAG